jgi:hypothetical protein
MTFASVNQLHIDLQYICNLLINYKYIANEPCIIHIWGFLGSCVFVHYHKQIVTDTCKRCELVHASGLARHICILCNRNSCVLRCHSVWSKRLCVCVCVCVCDMFVCCVCCVIHDRTHFCGYVGSMCVCVCATQTHIFARPRPGHAIPSIRGKQEHISGAMIAPGFYVVSQDMEKVFKFTNQITRCMICCKTITLLHHHK